VKSLRRPLAAGSSLPRDLIGAKQHDGDSPARRGRVHSHRTEPEPVFERRHDELGLGRILLDEFRQGLQLSGGGQQLFSIVALGLSGHFERLSLLDEDVDSPMSAT
jgi:hypothetical protein